MEAKENTLSESRLYIVIIYMITYNDGSYTMNPFQINLYGFAGLIEHGIGMIWED